MNLAIQQLAHRWDGAATYLVSSTTGRVTLHSFVSGSKSGPKIRMYTISGGTMGVPPWHNHMNKFRTEVY